MCGPRDFPSLKRLLRMTFAPLLSYLFITQVSGQIHSGGQSGQQYGPMAGGSQNTGSLGPLGGPISPRFGAPSQSGANGAAGGVQYGVKLQSNQYGRTGGSPGGQYIGSGQMGAVPDGSNSVSQYGSSGAQYGTTNRVSGQYTGLGAGLGQSGGSQQLGYNGAGSLNSGKGLGFQGTDLYVPDYRDEGQQHIRYNGLNGYTPAWYDKIGGSTGARYVGQAAGQQYGARNGQQNNDQMQQQSGPQYSVQQNGVQQLRYGTESSGTQNGGQAVGQMSGNQLSGQIYGGQATGQPYGGRTASDSDSATVEEPTKR